MSDMNQPRTKDSAAMKISNVNNLILKLTSDSAHRQVLYGTAEHQFVLSWGVSNAANKGKSIRNTTTPEQCG